MLALGPLAVLNPWLLAALAALPALWLILRVLPPAAKRLRFPGVRLLLGLSDRERQPDRTPWPLLLLRMLILAALICAFAEPVLNPRPKLAGSGPVLVLIDGGWGSAPGWVEALERADTALDQAERAGRPAILLSLAEPDAPLAPAAPADLRGALARLAPQPWAPLREDAAARIAGSGLEAAETVWIADGLAGGEAELGAALRSLGPVALVLPDRPAAALAAPRLDGDALVAEVLRADAGLPETRRLSAFAAEGAGPARRIGATEAVFAAPAARAEARLALPLELRNRVAQIALDGVESAGAVALTDEAVRRRRVGLVSGEAVAAQRLTAQTHYLRAALSGRAEVEGGTLAELVARRPDMIVLADIGRLTTSEEVALTEWLDQGGLLLRFAGPHLAAAAERAALLPVPLRGGDRALGGAMAWAQPQRIAPFPEGSPFAGLVAPEEATVSRQLLARPGPDLAARSWAMLEDGTPLVTAAAQGAGRVALFHVAANAEWSTLPLSGLFVQMLDRLLGLAGGGARPDAAALQGQTARAVALLDGFGRLSPVEQAALLPAERLAAPPGPDAPPGLYQLGEARLAVNLFRPGDALAPLDPPAGAALEKLGAAPETPLARWLLLAAALGFALDAALALAYAGRLRGALAGAALALLLIAAPDAPRAEPAAPEALAGAAAFAHLLTGDPRRDRLAKAGLDGLGAILAARSAVEPGPAQGVRPGRDDLALYPLLYWPVAAGDPALGDAAAASLNAFMRSGGVLVIDTADHHLDIGGGSPGMADLRRIAAGLDLPPLEPVPPDHVLTRAFYLLDSFPGRWDGARVWVEASEREEDTPFASRNDGVSPVVIGAGDWAGAWALDAAGRPLAPIAGLGGARQREMAFRFGVNLVMYALTGNYKSDQVHVPALLERLGQ